MNRVKQISLLNERLFLLADRCIYLPDYGTLLIADLHLGKVNHFRKNGIGLPTSANTQNYVRMKRIIENVQPKEVYYLGDLFHSSYNEACEEYRIFQSSFPQVKFYLIEGNHDILDIDIYEALGITILPRKVLGPFILTHEPDRDCAPYYNLCGHIHPGIHLVGKGKQALRLPCYLFTSSFGILPAFGNFTGLSMVKATKADQVFAIANQSVTHIAV